MTVDTEIKIFCENVKKLRISKKLSKEEMAKKLKISTKSLEAIEGGKVPSHISTELLFIINKQFGIAPKDIFLPLDTF